MPEDLPIATGITVPGDSLEVKFTTSSGPGGQNVNKVHTRAVLRLSLEHLEPLLPPDALERLRRQAGPAHLTDDGVLHVASERTRHQSRNLTDARERLAEIIRAALPRPKPRKATAPSRSAKRRRLEDKRKRSEIKQARGRPQDRDD